MFVSDPTKSSTCALLLALLALLFCVGTGQAQVLGVYKDANFTPGPIEIAVNTPFSVWVGMQSMSNVLKGAAWHLDVAGQLQSIVVLAVNFQGTSGLYQFEDRPGPRDYYWFTPHCPAGATGDFLLAEVTLLATADATFDITPGPNPFEAPPST